MWPHARHRVHLARRPTTVYEVDLSLHQTELGADVPSRTDGCPFHAAITLQWRVTDPSQVIRHRVVDVAEALAPHLLRRVRGITRGYDIRDASAAEDELNKQLGRETVSFTAPAPTAQPPDADRLGAEYGLWTRCIVHLSLDEAAAQHKARMAQLAWDYEAEEAEQKVRLLKEDNQRQITTGRIEMYRDIIATGDIERFALQLANNPGDMAAIDKIISEEERVSRRDTIDFVARMVETGVIERWQVSDHIKIALGWLREATARVIPDAQETPGGPARERRHGRSPVIPGDTEPELAPPPADDSNPDGPPSDAHPSTS